MKRIQLTQGKFALVDDEDYEFLNQWKWYVDHIGNCWYATTLVGGVGSKKKVRMHKMLCIGKEIDHKNHNGLDNRRENLRSCTRSQNNMNSRKQFGCSSKYKGVQFHKQNCNFRAYGSIRKKQIHLGSFSTEDDAAKAYNDFARNAHGEFAYLNKIGE